MLRRIVLTPILLAGCASPVRDGPASSPEDEIRRSFCDQLRVLAVDGNRAVARSASEVLAYERGADQRWVLITSVPLPADWEDEAASGFSTYADESRLRSSYLSFLRLTTGKPVDPDPRSEKSPLLGQVRRRQIFSCEPLCNVVDESLTYSVHCTGTEGRYGFFLVDGLFEGCVADWCLSVMAYPRFVVFRADDGKQWLVFDEAVVAEHGRAW